MKAVLLQVDEQMLRHALHLPDDVAIDEVVRDPFCYGRWHLRLVGERFAEVPPGRYIPQARVMLTTTRHECGHETITAELS
jgi:hypothetical protein